MKGKLADQPRNAAFAVRSLWRKMARRLVRGPVSHWRFIGPTPERILIAPPDLRMADAHIGSEFLQGRYALSGKIVDAGTLSPFRVETPGAQWEAALHNFRWLRHIREGGGREGEALARKLAVDWIALYGRTLHGLAWDPDVTARRIIAWMQHSSTLLRNANLEFYQEFLKSLAVQVRYLRAITPGLEVGEPRLRCRIALAFAALCLPVSHSRLNAATRNLEAELKLQILPDGIHLSRNPETVLELLTDLLPLRQTYASQSETPPSGLVSAVERLLPALRFFRHRDGALANFNGAGYAMQERMAAVLRYDDTGGSPLSAAPHGGYQRLVMGGTTIIADTGHLPPAGADNEAHAGCLSIEMSSGRHRYIVNCGSDFLSSPDFRLLARSTAAHSTATVNDTSSCRFVPVNDPVTGEGINVISGPRKVSVSRLDDEGQLGFKASHDAYLRGLGVIHHREIILSHSGSVLEGRDSFLGADHFPVRTKGRDLVTIRFHLSPQVHVTINDDGQIMLMADRDDTWVFTCNEVAPAMAESLFFAGISGPQKTRMIVLEFYAFELPEVNWQLTRTGLGAWTR